MASPDPLVERLYDCAQTLSNAKDKAGDHADDYKVILSGVKGTVAAKRLASQFIARFFVKFPQFGNESLDAIVDLCEDDDVNIRKQAIKDLPAFCREKKDFVPKIADILSQLLATGDASEMVVVQNSIMSLFRKDCKGTIIGLFSQIKTGGDVGRERALKFLFCKIKTQGKELLNKEAEVQLFEEVKACTFEGCTGEEFRTFMSLLGMTSIPKSVTGQSMIVEMVAKMIDLSKDFQPEEEEAIDRIVQTFQAAMPYFSTQVQSTKFCEYLCLKVLPEWDSILSDDQAKILKILAELCMFTATFENGLGAVGNIYKTLMEYLPQPPETTNPEVDVASKFEFTKVECLLFTFHTVGQMAPQFLTENPETLKQFKARLQYFALGIQGYIRKLREHLDPKTRAERQDPETKIKAEALKSATNINSLIKDLFHSPPSYKTKIVVSWRTQQQNLGKRKSITFQEPKDELNSKKKTLEGSKTPQPSQKGGVYAPPQGKYSGNLSSKQSAGRHRGGGGDRFKGGRKKSF